MLCKRMSVMVLFVRLCLSRHVCLQYRTGRRPWGAQRWCCSGACTRSTRLERPRLAS